MDTTSMNSKNSETSDPNRLLLNLLIKINSKRSDKYVALPNRSIYYRQKYIKKSYKKINSKYQLWRRMKNLS